MLKSDGFSELRTSFCSHLKRTSQKLRRFFEKVLYMFKKFGLLGHLVERSPSNIFRGWAFYESIFGKGEIRGNPMENNIFWKGEVFHPAVINISSIFPQFPTTDKPGLYKCMYWAIFQSWRCQVYLLQLLHLFLWVFYFNLLQVGHWLRDRGVMVTF